MARPAPAQDVPSLWDAIKGPEYLGKLSHQMPPDWMKSRWGPIRDIRRGTLQLSSDSVRLLVALPTSFPHAKPLYFVFPSDALGLLPHVEPDGYICYADDENLLLDTSNPTGILRQSCDLVRKVLQEGLSGSNAWDFVEEFEEYWGRTHSEVKTYLSFVPPGKKATLIRVGRNKRDDTRWFAPEPKLDTSHASKVRQRKHRYSPALYVPFDDDSLVRPPNFGQMWSAEELRNLVDKFVSEENRARIQDLRKFIRTEQHHALFSLPSPDGGHAWFGLRCNVPKAAGAESRHPLISHSNDFCLLPVRIQRRDADFLIERGGGHPQLQGRHALLVGCGAVGSIIANQLAKAGIGHLTLVDNDVLAPENTFRHSLGGRDIGEPKVRAIRSELRERFRFVETDTHRKRIEELLREQPHFLHQFDLIIAATGDPNIELLLNERIHTSSQHPPAVFTWLEPLGLGGHALLTNHGTTAGCFACLFRPSNRESSGGELHNSASFAAPGQVFTERLSGCRTTFVPYGAVDATQTACLAVRLAIDVLRNRTRDNPILSWKGDPTDFRQEGYRVSDRFRYDRNELFATRFAYKNPDCSVCQESP